MLVFKLATYDLALGGQRCARLERLQQIPAGKPAPLALWGEGGNRASEFGEAGLQRALANPANVDLLKAMLGRDATCRVVLREVGAGGGCDVVGIFEADGASHLLMVDCKGARGPTLKQLAQALRIALATAPNISPPTPVETVRLVLLARWNRSAPPQAQRVTRWLGRHGKVTSPAPEWWGFSPFAIGDEEYVAFAPWDQFASGGVVESLGASSRRAWQEEHAAVSEKRALAPDSSLKLDLRARRGFVRASIEIGARVHESALGDAALGDDARLTRELLSLGSFAPARWRFAEETNDKGFVRLNWDLCGWPSADVLRDARELEQLRDAFLSELLARLRHEPAGQATA